MITIASKLKTKLDLLKKGDSISKDEIVKSIWGYSDHFTQRSFDVYLSKYKKENPNKKLKVRMKTIFRLQ